MAPIPVTEPVPAYVGARVLAPMPVPVFISVSVLVPMPGSTLMPHPCSSLGLCLCSHPSQPEPELKLMPRLGPSPTPKFSASMSSAMPEVAVPSQLQSYFVGHSGSIAFFGGGGSVMEPALAACAMYNLWMLLHLDFE